jgi:hypothetical protein
VPPVQPSHLQKILKLKGFEDRKQWQRLKDLKYKIIEMEISRIRHTCQLLHPLDKLSDLGFGTSCGMTVKGYVSAY